MFSLIKQFRSQKGFTLVELLVVIAVIGLIASVVVVSLGTVREKARDTRRKEDLDALRKALEIYYAEEEKYPTTNGAWTILNGVDDSLTKVLVPKYIEAMPKDPKGTNQLPYVYKYASDGDHFALDAAIETNSDKDQHIIGTWQEYNVLIYRILSSN